MVIKFEFESEILTSTNFLLISNLCVEISAVSKIHYNTEAPLVHERLFICDNVWMTHSFENMNLNRKENSEQLKLPLNIICPTYLIDGIFALFSVHF